MRPYLAILKDSVREAVRSRTLPFLLAFFTIVLLVTAPLGLRDETAWRLEPGNLIDAPLLAAQLRRDEAKEGVQPGDQVLTALPADVRQAALDPENAEISDARFRDALNADVLTSAEFYDEAAFSKVDLTGDRPLGFGVPADEPSELAGLLEEGPDSLSVARLGRLNRLLLAAAFPQAIAPPGEERVYLVYGPWDVAEEFSNIYRDNLGIELNRSGVRLIARQLLETIAGSLAGPIGVLIALLVTASLIPQTFEGGAIDLLLSKPVSRTAMFLTKFLGGCAFVGLAGLYLCAGLWLIAGLRLGVWDAGLIAASGILVVQFAVFYSVSAAVGVLWRNPIVCVMAAGGVWALSWLLNVAWGATQVFDNADRPVAVVAGASEVFKSDGRGRVARWDPGEQTWTPALFPEMTRRGDGGPLARYPLAGPLFIPDTNTLAAIDLAGGRRLYSATAENDWAGTAGTTVPPLTTHLLIRPDGGPLFAGRLGVFAPRDGEEESTPEATGVFDAMVRSFGGQLGPDFEPLVSPPDDGTRSPAFPLPFAAAIDPQTGDLALYAGGVLHLYPAGESASIVEITLYDAAGAPGTPAGRPAVVVAAGGGGAVVVTGDGVGKTVAADGSVKDFAPMPGNRPRSIRADLATGRLALAAHDGPVWVGSIDGSGAIIADDATAAGWAEDGGLWIGTGPDEVTRFEPAGDGFRQTDRLAPPAGLWDRTVTFGLTPLHYLLPDSVGLGETLSGLFQGDEEEASEAFGADLDLRQPVLTQRFWGPLIHNLAFMAVILALTCWHVSRTDF